HDEDTSKDAEHRAAAAEETGAADDDRCNRIELGADAGIGKTGIGAAGEEERGQPREKARQRIDQDEDAVDADAAHPRRLRIAADGVDMPANRGLVEEPGEAAIDEEEHQRAYRYRPEWTEPRERDLLGAEETHGVAQPRDRPSVGDEVGQPAGDVERAERHDEGMRQAQEREAE